MFIRLNWPRAASHFVLVLAGVFFLIRYGTISASRLMSNHGLLLISHMRAEGDAAHINASNARLLLREALETDPLNTSAHHGLGLLHWQAGRDQQALQEWQHLGFTGDDYVRFARLVDGEDVDTRLRWYRLAEQVQPTNEMLWLDVGMLCQQLEHNDEICDRFLEHNHYNWIVDPFFRFDRAAWRFNRREAVTYNLWTAVRACHHTK